MGRPDVTDWAGPGGVYTFARPNHGYTSRYAELYL
jgi:hypothetical protein